MQPSDGDVFVWYRKSDKDPWKVAHWAASREIATHLIGVGRSGSGDWLLLPKGTLPGYARSGEPVVDHKHQVPASKADLPTRVTTIPRRHPSPALPTAAPPVV